MDVAHSIRMAVDTGKVVLGSQRSIKLVLTGEPKAVVLAANAPAMLRADVLRYAGKASVPVIPYSGTSIELGTVCGKPFPISVMCVMEQGNSDILSAATGAAQEGARR
jgi:large subunit ribosomal protein L30e